MLKIIVEPGKGGLERALKQFKRKVIKTKQVKELREREKFTKPSAKKRKQKIKAVYKQKMFGDSAS